MYTMSKNSWVEFLDFKNLLFKIYFHIKTPLKHLKTLNKPISKKKKREPIITLKNQNQNEQKHFIKLDLVFTIH